MALTEEQKQQMRERLRELRGGAEQPAPDSQISKTGQMLADIRGQIEGTPSEEDRQIGLQREILDNQKEEPREEKKGFFSRAKGTLSDLGGVIPKVGEAIAGAGKRGAETIKKTVAGELNPVAGTVAFAGDIARGASESIGEVILGAGKAALPKEVEDLLQANFIKLAKPLVGPISNLTEAWDVIKEKHPNTAEAIEGFANIATLMTEVTGSSAALTTGRKGIGVTAKIAGEVADTALDVTRKGINTATDTVKAGIKPLSGLTEKANVVGGFIKEKAIDTGRSIGGGLKRLPENIQESKIQRKVIDSLPTESQTALKGGLELPDVQLIETAKAMPDNTFKKMKEMAKASKKLQTNELGKNPSEIVGNEFRQPMVDMDKALKQVGGELGEIVKDLPRDTRFMADQDVLTSLRGVRGLEGLKVDALGKLDFSETTLAGSLTKADRSTIIKAYNDIKGKTPFQMHNQRQELFEVLGGKRRSTVELTKVQENALEAIRGGLSNFLDKKSTLYKKKNAEYAQIVNPLKDMQKAFGKIKKDSDPNFLDIKASNLARRITSHASSNADIRQVLRNMQNVLLSRGIKPNSNIETLQNFYNSLQKYYDITRGSAFASQIEVGTSKALSKSGLIEAGINLVSKDLKVTPATQRKAIELLLGL